MAKKQRGFDLDDEVDSALTRWADRLKTTKSSLVNLLLLRGLIDLENEDFAPYDRLRESRSFRHKYLLWIEDLKDKLRDLTGRY